MEKIVGIVLVLILILIQVVRFVRKKKEDKTPMKDFLVHPSESLKKVGKRICIEFVLYVGISILIAGVILGALVRIYNKNGIEKATYYTIETIDGERIYNVEVLRMNETYVEYIDAENALKVVAYRELIAEDDE